MHQFLFGAVPRPQFHQRVQPQVDVPAGDVRPQVPHLLLAASPDFLHVVEHLFERTPVGECLDGLLHARVHIAAGEDLWAGRFFHDHDPDHSPERPVRCQEHLELFDDLFPRDCAENLLPTVAMSSPLRQRDPIHSVDPFAAAAVLRLDRRQIE